MNYLETIVRNHPQDLPVEWQWRRAELLRFSAGKSLYNFQESALSAALKCLWLYYGEHNAAPLGPGFVPTDEQHQLAPVAPVTKDSPQPGPRQVGPNGSQTAVESLPPGAYLWQQYRAQGAEHVVNATEVNRMGLWMATGSGKTLVIIKTIEMLALLMGRANVPKRDLMFLAYRDVLLEQFKQHVAEYNASNPRVIINLVDLKDYERTKNDYAMPFAGRFVNVFHYRADLFFEKSTAKKINPHSCDNNGNWYVLLDEAHRGDSKDSTLQKIYREFSRNGFLFNFSATFVDDIDRATCAYNFNLERFVGEGYGKNIYVSDRGVEGFATKSDFSDQEKQKTVLKALILHSCIKQELAAMRRIDPTIYHNPLLLTIVNKVTEKGSDLRLFFAELEKVANGKVSPELFTEASQEVAAELSEAHYLFGQGRVIIKPASISSINFKDVLQMVFNANHTGQIEVLRVPGNKQEIVFKMKTADQPFALIKIGDISAWVKDILSGYDITDRYEDASVFSRINAADSAINILMGSRAFYEGWDSNRPNIILFVNIGVGKDSRKFVLQAVGRGIRIEPIRDKRQRLDQLHAANELQTKPGLYDKVSKQLATLESLFVFGTNAENLKSIINSLRAESRGEVFDLGEEFVVNPEAAGKLLLVPEYRLAEQLFADQQGKYPISAPDLQSARSLLNRLGDKVMLAKYDCTVATLHKSRAGVAAMQAYQEERVIARPELTIGRLLDYFDLRQQVLEKFNTLAAADIVHFRNIRLHGSAAKSRELRKKIRYLRKLPAQEAALAAMYGKVPVSEYNEQRDLFEAAKSFQLEDRNAGTTGLRYLANHYYHPLLVSTDERVDYLTHVVTVPGEVQFLDALEQHVSGGGDNAFASCDWWLFSKLDETLDRICIPYYSASQNRFVQFNPDFVFWLQQGADYRILFVDPKGTAHAQYQHKADGYAQLFGAVANEKLFQEHDLNIKVYLRFFGGDNAQVAAGYRDYWLDSISGIAKIWS